MENKGSQTITKIKIDHWLVTVSSLQFAEHADHLFTAQEPRDVVLGRRVTIVHSVELCLCHTLIVWISIFTEVSDMATLVYKNRSQILIVLLAGHLSPRHWGAAACSGEERTLTNKLLYYKVLLLFLCTVCTMVRSHYLILTLLEMCLQSFHLVMFYITALLC